VAATVPALARTEVVRIAPQPEQVNVTTTISGLQSVQDSAATRCPQRLGVYCHEPRQAKTLCLPPGSIMIKGAIKGAESFGEAFADSIIREELW
jgi:hypothetical protein